MVIVDTTVWIDYFRGIPVRKTIDCLIATFCLREQHALLHRDRDFAPFEQLLELAVVHP